MSNRLNQVGNGNRKVRTEYSVKRERFCAVWQASSCLQEVLDVLGMPGNVAMARASQYRAQGVPLKKFQGGRRKHQASPNEATDAELGQVVERVLQNQLSPEGSGSRYCGRFWRSWQPVAGAARIDAPVKLRRPRGPLLSLGVVAGLNHFWRARRDRNALLADGPRPEGLL